MKPIELAPDYYLHNFLLLIDSVEQRYYDLLSEEESTWVKVFRGLPANAQMLCVRLLSRKGVFFRYDKLAYSEINNLAMAVETLNNAKFIEINHSDWAIEDIAVLFTKPELLKLFPALSQHKLSRKQALVDELNQHSPSLGAFKQKILQIRHQQYLDTFLLLFFGNRHQDLSQFVLSDLGLHQFETYSVDKNTRLFTERHQIQQWLTLSDLSDHYWLAREEKDQLAITTLATEIPSAFEWPPLERKRQQLINHIARDLERFNMLDQALTLFRESTIPPSRERQVRILDKLQQHEQALQLTLAIKQQPSNEEESEVAARLEKKLSRTLNRTYQQDPKPKFNESHLILPNSGQRVELAVADHYASQGWSVYYLENSLLCGLFGLAFWDIIFSPIPGAFLNPYQRSPRDMFHQGFYEQRESAIKHRLDEISRGEWQQWSQVYGNKQGLSNDWVNWQLLAPETVKQAIGIIPCDVLARLFERLIFDPKNNRSGFPDLIMFKDNDYQWVEVKGPGDKLQSNQVRWLKVFQKLDVPAIVAYVVWAN